MKRLQELDLIWEQTSNKISAFCEDKPQGRIIPALMKNLALSKMKDVKLLSAYFNESFVMFYPKLWLLFDAHHSLEFFGIYTSDFLDDIDSDNQSNQLPYFCIRRAIWNRSDDFKSLEIASDKLDYILSERQTNCNVIFLSLDQCPELLQLISEGIEMTEQGIKLQECSQSESKFQKITINISADLFDLNLLYSPQSMTNIVLDEWIMRIRNYLNEISPKISYLPDDRFRISYESSLFDNLNLLDALIEKSQKG